MLLKFVLLFASLSLGLSQGLAFKSLKRGAFFQKTSVTSGFIEKYFDQYVDHFNFQSNGEKTYSQRYLINLDYWNSTSGPIFFYTGNEGDIVSFKDASGFVTSFAEESNAMIIFAEHRYYGTSLPFGEESFDKGNIGYLTIEQAMADYATLILNIKNVYGAKDAPVITFGGSYGGQLAAYMRIRYPNIVTGALAASAPLNWITGKGDSHGFWESITRTFSAYDKCESVVREGFAGVARLANEGSYDEIKSQFNLCHDLNKDNYNHFLGWARNAFTLLAMLNYPYATNFLAPLPGYPVQEACERAGNSSSNIAGLAKVTWLLYGGDENPDQCFDMMDQYVECSDPTGCGHGNDAKAWDYQACTEIILPGGTDNSPTDMFPALSFTPEMRKKYCEAKYGVSPRLAWIRMSFWTDNLKVASNIIFSNGDLDPWGPGGITEELSKSLPVVLVQGGAHHFDLRGPTDADPKSVQEARETEKEIIKKWIN